MPGNIVAEDNVILDGARCPVVAWDDNRAFFALAPEAVSSRNALPDLADEYMATPKLCHCFVLTQIYSPRCPSG